MKVLGWLVVALLVWVGSDRSPTASAPRWSLLGPVAHAGADLAWIAGERARLDGDHDRALSLAVFALELDPAATAGWDRLAHYQAMVLGSPLREPNAERRAHWLRAGVGTALAGEGAARRPEVLAFLRGMLFQMHAELDPDTAWPGGTAALWREAAAAYSDAERAGHVDATWMRAHAVERADGQD